MIIEQAKSVFGIALVKYLTDLIMLIPSEKFDKKRFAPIVSFLVAVGASVGESLITHSMDVPSAIARGIVVSMAASGAQSVGKNYYQQIKKGGNKDGINQ